MPKMGTKGTGNQAWAPSQDKRLESESAQLHSERVLAEEAGCGREACRIRVRDVRVVVDKGWGRL